MRYLLTSLFCVFTLSLAAQETCPNVFDYDNDGNIAINDFIAMLGYFGDTDSDSDGVFDSEDDCTDETACNYQSNPTYHCYYSDVLGVCGGWCMEDADGDGICDWNCGEGLVYDGYDYSTVLIGAQCWFAENCRYLPSVSPGSEGDGTDPHYYVYGYDGTDVDSAKATAKYETYGVLYNWPAVMTDEICPTGWHIPSDGEWQTMEISLGMSEAEAASEGWRGSPVGDYLKSTSGWNSGGNASNSSGFTGMGGGFHFSFGFFGFVGYYGGWWSASESGSPLWKRVLDKNNDSVGREENVQSNNGGVDGFSARCVRD
jgi:uncharacterized protein (TIGR02145 family)